jgi:TonB-linked SusC/RagA family outer membrane protein
MKNILIMICLSLVAGRIKAQDTTKQNAVQLKEVSVISNGYQKLAKGKITGSFVQLDSAILNRRVSPDILSRLEDVTSGLIFNRDRNSGTDNISIRGRSTLFANDQPLVILDNFPYEGDLAAINPNDVESITILKDAAAAAIWGARSGNGVIVITTRSGNYGQKTKVSFNSNFTYGSRPDLFYFPKMSSADYIDMEKKLFASGFYTSKEQSGNHDPLSPVVELLIAARDSKINSQDAMAAIEKLKVYDVRNDEQQYLYRNSQAQQYALQVSGGTAQQKFLLSAGYDKSLLNLIGNNNDRLSLRGSNTYAFDRGKGELSTDVYFIQSRSQTNNRGTGAITMGGGSVYPYARLADDQGTPLSITHDYRQGFVEGAAAKGLLDWGFNPLQEIALADQHAQSSDLRLNSRLRYNIFAGMSGEILYQYTRSNTIAKNLQSADSYYVRNLVNLYTQLNADGTLNRAIPLGAVQDLNQGLSTGNSLRGQLNYQRRFNQDHDLNALAGYEIRNQETMNNISRLYGFDPLNGTNRAVDYLAAYTNYASPSAAALRVPFQDQETAFSDRYISWYGNAAYTFRQRYTLTGSARLDRSNIFGVRTNQKGVPLYSAGLSWNLSDEGFYKLKWLPYLKARATFGYNGNVDRSLSAVTTATYYSGTNTETNLPYAIINNPPNPDLRWERVEIYNLGLDFGLRKSVLSGSIDLYHKKGIDLIGSTTMPSSTGIITFRGNTASTSGKGADLVLNSVNAIGSFKWTANLLFSYVKDEVLKYGIKANANNYLEEGDIGAYPYEGRPLSAIYSYRWAGLDPKTGDPQGYLNGAVSKDYSAIVQTAKPEDLVYNGPARPPVFGAFRNTFEYRNFSVSVNISYRLGYYFRRNSIQYEGVLTGQGGHGDYSKRWQKPGDEVFTQVPSLPAARDLNRDRLYTYSSALVEKGDHIRLQDINLGYMLSKKEIPGLPFSRIQLYAYANNLGLIWTANKQGLDPDYPVLKQPKTISIGVRAEF